MIKRKPKPSELSRGIININKGTGLPQTTLLAGIIVFFRSQRMLRISGVVCKPPYAALGGNELLRVHEHLRNKQIK